MLVRGLRDRACDRAARERRHEVLPEAKVVTFPNVGHFVPEAEGEEAAAAEAVANLGQHLPSYSASS